MKYPVFYKNSQGKYYRIPSWFLTRFTDGTTGVHELDWFASGPQDPEFESKFYHDEVTSRFILKEYDDETKT